MNNFGSNPKIKLEPKMEPSSDFQVRSSGNTVTVGNVSYRVVGTASTSSSQNTSGNSSSVQTAVLASPLNGQFYVIGNPSEVLSGSRSIAPRFSLDTSSGSSSLASQSGMGSNPRHDRRRATHNEVERRRRDNINAWIMKLGRIIPMDEESGPPKSNNLSKGGILARACEFINELRATNRDLMAKLGGGLTVRETDNMRLQRQVEELKEENAILREQVETLSKQLEGIDPMLS